MTTKIVYNACYGGFSLSLDAVKWLKDKGEPFDEKGYEDYPEYHFNHLERHNPILAECVEALGDLASGSCSRLVIATISGTVYRIEECDGYESVVEPNHQEWISVHD